MSEIVLERRILSRYCLSLWIFTICKSLHNSFCINQQKGGTISTSCNKHMKDFGTGQKGKIFGSLHPMYLGLKNISKEQSLNQSAPNFFLISLGSRNRSVCQSHQTILLVLITDYKMYAWNASMHHANLSRMHIM